MSVSALQSASTLNSIIPNGYAVIPTGQTFVIVNAPSNKTIWLDAVILASFYGEETGSFVLPSVGTILGAYGGGDGLPFPSLVIKISTAQAGDVKVYWCVLNNGTVGENPPP
jgi:hypothetical protein